MSFVFRAFTYSVPPTPTASALPTMAMPATAVRANHLPRMLTSMS
jgi:hypothetical protein